ncbi:MAG TPA: nicotinamide-nucleotide amidohydrolase family protein [Gammaproteobacteria bacterium]|jgi:nicotinamide-nucleotide amidase
MSDRNGHINDLTIERLASRVGEVLQIQHRFLVTAESCTGGWLAKAVTDIAGSSRWYDRGFITYSNAAKIDQLGVAETVLEQEGAVSEATVRQMALGALDRSQAHLAVAISGIAGPDGGTADKPVGTVWIAWATVGPTAVVTKLCHFTGDREAVRRASVIGALEGIMAISEAKV